LNELTEQQLSDLQRYGFDLELQRQWQHDVKKGVLSKKNNAVEGELLAPAPGSVQKLPGESTKAHRHLHELGQRALAGGEVGIAVLNGGMATRFGGVVKGIVPVLGAHRSFLGLTIEDVCRHRDDSGARIPLFCMNSFATDEATKAHCREHDNFGLADADLEHFTQSVAVRMTKKGELFELENGEASPYGPGHGDFPSCFRRCGALRRFLDAGGKYLLVRNVDNLGARIDPIVLGHHIESGCDMTVEVAPKWPEDVGGSPLQFQGRTQLIEQLCYPPTFDPHVVDVFNTNTFTFTASALDRDFDLRWYYVEKEVEGRPAVQVEHLIGELTAHLSTSFLRVRRNGRRSRFLPVKTPDDLNSAREEIAEMYDGADYDDEL